jgi:hypothetical protein
MTGDSKMFNSIKPKDIGISSITFDDNSKGDVKGLGRIATSNDMSISNVLLVEILNFNLLSIVNCVILVPSASLEWMMLRL